MAKDNKQTTADVVKDVVEKQLPTLVGATDLYKAFLGQSNVEKVKEEDWVMREILKGTSRNKIIQTLQAKYPETYFSYDDLEKFIARNNEKLLIYELNESFRNIF